MEHLTVRPVIFPAGMHDDRDVETIAKRWYTEQRGRVVGNTAAWDDLSKAHQDLIAGEIDNVLVTMRHFWTKR